MVRRDFVKDESLLRERLAPTCILDLTPLIDFQLKYGGYTKKLLNMVYAFGLLHKHPKYVKANEPKWEEDEGTVVLSAADAHPSFGYM